MTIYNKLKIAILTIMTSHTVSAITIDPIHVQSGSGDLLYAEMKFHNADPNARIEASLADADDMRLVGITNQAPGHLNFYTRRSGDGSGVIVITSSRPIIDSELNILLKVKEGNATHIQQIKTSLTRNRVKPTPPQMNASGTEKVLTPKIIVSEKDIALNLPSSTQYQSLSPSISTNSAIVKSSSEKDIQRPLVISVTAPPDLKTTANVPAKVNTTPENTQTSTTKIASTQNNDVEKITKIVESSPKLIQKADEAELNNVPAETAKQSESVQPQLEKQETVKAEPNKPRVQHPMESSQRYVVQANESLWKISAKVAAETNQSVSAVMKQIKENNADAFIQGDVNRIRRGTALNLSTSYNTQSKTKYKTPTTPLIARKQSGAMKFRLDQAEMSLIADNEQESAQGSAKKNSSVNQTTTELSTKVMTSRQKTVKLQNNVTQLTTALQQKNQRIQLLNARLAQLQQQLEQQNVKKPNS